MATATTASSGPQGARSQTATASANMKPAASTRYPTNAAGSALVPMNAPYRFDEYDGWVVVEEGSNTPLLST